MSWSVYWFMLPACVVIASAAMFSGISGAALLTPVFLIAVPLLAIPTLSTVEAIGTALVLETAGFGAGVAAYVRRGLPDYALARRLLFVAVPLGLLGAIVSRAAPAELLKGIYGAVMFAVAAVLVLEARRKGAEAREGDGEGPPGEGPRQDEGIREIEARDGTTFRYRPRDLGLSRALTGTGALMAGMISTGVGEATLPNLIRRVRMPAPVAAATSTLVVAGTVVAAALAHGVQLGLEGGLGAIPWNLLVWAVPGAVVGAQVGARLQGKVDERKTDLFFAGLFLAIGTAFLLSVTLLAGALSVD